MPDATLNQIDLSIIDTFPKLLIENEKLFGDQVAMREKDLGIWKEFTWSDCLSQVKNLTRGLAAIGVGKDDVVGLLGQNRPEWIFGQIASHAVGAKSLGIYKDSLPDEVGYLVSFTSVKVLIVEDEEQVDKLLALGDEIPTVEKIIYSDPRGMRKYDDPRLLDMAQFIDLGNKLEASDVGLFEQLVDKTTGDDVAILCTTSGTTSRPKLAELQGGPFLRHCKTSLALDPLQSGDDYVAVLELPWIGEQFFAAGLFLVVRHVVNFAEDSETVVSDMREIAPHTLLYPPRVWEMITADIQAKMLDSSYWKRWLYNVAIKSGLKAIDEGRKPWLANLLVGRALRDRLGFSRLKSAMTGGAPLGPDVFRYFRAIGVPLRQVYGQTEMAGLYCGHTHDDVDYDTVGKPYPGTDVEIREPDGQGLGEVVVRHPGMFKGYLDNPEATKADVHDGWMFTGDAGYFNDNGHLIVIDRMRDLARLANGDRFSPQFIELKLKFSQYIGECVALGNERDYVTAFICIRYSIVSKIAEAQQIPFTGYSDLAGREEVREMVRKEIVSINEHLPENQRIHRFLLLYKDLDPDDGELTRTRKVRRGTINERYGNLIEALYDDSSKIDVDDKITLQDGRTQRIATTIDIITLIEPPRTNGKKKLPDQKGKKDQ